MKSLKNLAIIGSGPTALYLLKNIELHIDTLKEHIETITIFEKEKIAGMGMPYNPQTTDIYNLANISSEEIPLLQETFSNWLQHQSIQTLDGFNISQDSINEKDVYNRVALGQYFHAQFELIIEIIKSAGIKFILHCDSEVLDIIPVEKKLLKIEDSKNHNQTFSAIIIATGHGFKQEDKANQGYFASPWPIHKLLPNDKKLYNFPIGTLGASLSAFDVVTSLSHRHGKFIKTEKKLKFLKFKQAEHFKIVLHSAEGWLPHLQYEQQEPIREIYRHFNRKDLLLLLESDGFLHLESYFDSLCREPLILAFKEDKIEDVKEKLENKNFKFSDFVKTMSERHEYTNSFKGMKKEMRRAKNSVENNIPICWMETLDDLMYSLNYHAELLPAEDHQFFHKEIMAFLMNVIAALPLQSAEILLALYEAKCIELKEGCVTINKSDSKATTTKITLKSNKGKEHNLEYKLFINCGGQNKMELEDFPFSTLVDQGIVQNATARFSTPKEFKKHKSDIKEDQLIESKLKLSGIDIDATYRTINKKGKPNNNLYNINFTHTNGLRPYSYGLQACNATSKILVESWLDNELDLNGSQQDITEITKFYENTEDL